MKAHWGVLIAVAGLPLAAVASPPAAPEQLGSRPGDGVPAISAHVTSGEVDALEAGVRQRAADLAEQAEELIRAEGAQAALAHLREKALRDRLSAPEYLTLAAAVACIARLAPEVRDCVSAVDTADEPDVWQPGLLGLYALTASGERDEHTLVGIAEQLTRHMGFPSRGTGWIYTHRDWLVVAVVERLTPASLPLVVLVEWLGRHSPDQAEAECLLFWCLSVRARAGQGESREALHILADMAGSCLYDLDRAEPLFRAGYEKALEGYGPDDALTLEFREGLARVAYARGDAALARQVLEDVVERRRRLFGGTDTGSLWGGRLLGHAYWALGDYERCEALFRRMQQDIRDELGPNHWEEGILLQWFADLWWPVDPARVEELLTESIRMQQARLRDGREQSALHYAQGLLALAARCWAAGERAKADEWYAKALEVSCVADSMPDTHRAQALDGLASFCITARRYPEAESLLREAARVSEETYGQHSLSYSEALGRLSRICGHLGKPAEALDLRRQAGLTMQTRIDHALSGASEGTALRAAQPAVSALMQDVSLVTADFRHDPDAIRWAAQQVLRVKGLVLDSLVRRRAGIPPQLVPAQPLMDWRDCVQQVALLASRQPQLGEEQAHRSELSSLLMRKAELEAQLSRLSSRFADEQVRRHAAPRSVAQRLGKGEVLVEILRTDIYSYRMLRWQSARYLVFILSPDGTVAMVDLGEAAPIDQAVGEWRCELRQSPRFIRTFDEGKAERRLAKRGEMLYGLVLEPLEKHLVGVSTIIVSPDGQLDLVPFGALPGRDGRYLVERFCFTYVGAGRDVLGFGSGGRETGRALVIGDPDFDLTTAGALAQSHEPTDALVALRPRTTTDPLELQGAQFARLPATAREARSVGKLLRGTYEPTVKLRSDAVEQCVKSARSPRVLHLATHGFFLQDQELATGYWASRGLGAERGSPPGRLGRENPLLRSGLAVAGANGLQEERAGGVDDGILTALEIAAMDLTGTDLVVLSGCDTGLGDVQNGEGLCGLRRAFLHAGARTLVMSLAGVPDRATRKLMLAFYRRWLQGSGKAQALHEAKLQMIEQRRADHGAAHPYFWAGFVLVGDPG